MAEAAMRIIADRRGGESASADGSWAQLLQAWPLPLRGADLMGLCFHKVEKNRHDDIDRIEQNI